jgi:hypothetical protein
MELKIQRRRLRKNYKVTEWKEKNMENGDREEWLERERKM